MGILFSVSGRNIRGNVPGLVRGKFPGDFRWGNFRGILRKEMSGSFGEIFLRGGGFSLENVLGNCPGRASGSPCSITSFYLQLS